MASVQQLLYAGSPQHISAIMLEIEADWEPVYPQFVKYVSDLCSRKEEWALCFRDNVPNRGHNTNNVVEAAFRVLKDSILNRYVELHPHLSCGCGMFEPFEY